MKLARLCYRLDLDSEDNERFSTQMTRNVFSIRRTEEERWVGKMTISTVDLANLRFKGATCCRNLGGSQKGGAET